MIEKLSPNRKKFLQSLGITNDTEIPSSFFEKIRSYKEDTTPAEQFYCSDYTISGYFKIPFCMSQVVGTDHERYIGKSWLEAFMDLDRGEENLEMYFQNPDYYKIDLKSSKPNTNIGLVKKDNKFYIYSKAGGGNNRMMIMKIKYLAMAEKLNPEELEKEFTFIGNTRILPQQKETTELVEELMWNHEDLNIQVKNASTDPNTPSFNLYQGDFFNQSPIKSNLSEEELIKNVNEILNFKQEQPSSKKQR